MKIGELSRRSGVSMRSLRYYEQHGLLVARRGPNGYREYDESAIERAETIRMLFGMDFPREVVRTVLSCTGDASGAASHERLAEQLSVVRTSLGERIAQLDDTYRKIDAFLEGRRG